jgi:hypothetical protein
MVNFHLHISTMGQDSAWIPSFSTNAATETEPGNAGADVREDETGGMKATTFIDENSPGQRQSKRPRHEGFGCPYRKRNPKRFNVRDHGNCARVPFQNLSNLKYRKSD